MAGVETGRELRAPDKAPPASSYRSRNWRVSPRETVHRARRYSVFVKFMKGVLPMLAVALTVVVLVYALQPRETGKMALTFERLGRIDGDLAMVNPRLTGTDSDGQPFVVTAASAAQVGGSVETIKLVKVGADLSLKDGNMLHVTAASGTVDSVQHLLRLDGGIHFTTPNGYDVTTGSAVADLRAGTVRGDTPIVAEGAFGHIEADRFVLNKESRQLQFMGHVRMLLTGVAK